ncbi:hypothetical protein Mapa_015005 [Marchantia paleacea]|nr:hypothetical protein Mapa_015005 [Marchantia paleacea]
MVDKRVSALIIAPCFSSCCEELPTAECLTDSPGLSCDIKFNCSDCLTFHLRYRPHRPSIT